LSRAPDDIRYGGGRYLVDSSAWARRTQPAARESLDDLYQVGQLSFTLPQILELAHSTRTAAERRQFMQDVNRHTILPVDDRVAELAIETQAALWDNGRIRAAGAFDILLAAVCMRHDAAMIHYDRDYDHIKGVMPQFRASWVATNLS
jgi:predicted nucleic acid-binding protein